MQLRVAHNETAACLNTSTNKNNIAFEASEKNNAQQVLEMTLQILATFMRCCFQAGAAIAFVLDSPEADSSHLLGGPQRPGFGEQVYLQQSLKQRCRIHDFSCVRCVHGQILTSGRFWAHHWLCESAKPLKANTLTLATCQQIGLIHGLIAQLDWVVEQLLHHSGALARMPHVGSGKTQLERTVSRNNAETC